MRRISDLQSPEPAPTRTTQAPRSRRLPPNWARRARRHALAGVLVVAGIGLPAWAWFSGAAVRAGTAVHDAVVSVSGQAGLQVADVTVAGRSRTAPDHLLAALKVKRGDPILGLDLTVAKQRVEALPWVKTATVERRLPGVIHLTITEREPIALWQSEGRFLLVDKDGQAIADEVAGFNHLPLVVGESAPSHAAELLAVMTAQPALMKRIKAAVRVSERRWNLKLDDVEKGIEVRLPETDLTEAFKKLAELDRSYKLLERKVTMVDLRLPDRLVLKTTPDAMPAAASTGKTKPVPGKDA